ncbi:hypothetical protein M8U49_06850 [Enterobacter hormaechei]|uniref:hypothetical protein n=1 Tax=Enterobacter hormaechei TaxID=158836 RepID=UPI0010BE7CB7|nr:hypothetical protein [Enterobacter hormaechei]MCM8175772.1 hypothetical protein [Enterobacter hormaechei]QWS89633.1 hypothetical protein FCG85_016925 [Enterobacter hormaechei]
MKTIFEQLGENLANENGGGYGFVCIWRKKGDPLDDGSNHARHCSVGEFLSIQENQKGEWLIDGGWGAPPGAIRVRWNELKEEWEVGQ